VAGVHHCQIHTTVLQNYCRWDSIDLVAGWHHLICSNIAGAVKEQTTVHRMPVLRDELEFHLLSHLASNEDYGYRIWKRLASRNVKLEMPRMYKVLHQLEEEHWLCSELRDAKKADGKARSECLRRRFFRLTDAGRDRLRQLRKSMAAMAARVQASLNELSEPGQAADSE
jgi:DNA-binding PadR family transcriptional regulator